MTSPDLRKDKDAEPAHSSRLLLEEMIINMREGVVVLEKDLAVYAANPVARALLRSGGTSSSAPEDAITDEAMRAVFQRAIDLNERTDMKVEIRVGNDNRVYDLRVAPLGFAERKQQKLAIGIFYDITRMERLEKVRQEFLSNVSHELRTPLTSILAFVETLEEGGLEDGENNLRFLSVIRRNAERMHHLIDDILELSAIEAGKITVRPRRIQLAPLVEEVWALLAEKAAKLNISFTNDVSASTFVFADPHRLEQILNNLLGNAVKFNRDGGTVSVSYSKTKGYHQIRVADTGEGIGPEHLHRIFERFYRTDTARSRQLGGTGLGLAIVKHLARLHRGEARVDSTVGEGSVFTVDLADMS